MPLGDGKSNGELNRTGFQMRQEGISQEIDSSNDPHCKVKGLASEAKVPTTAEHDEAKLNVLEVKESVARLTYKTSVVKKDKKTNKNEFVERKLGC
jgi:hypothetical protein